MSASATIDYTPLDSWILKHHDASTKSKCDATVKKVACVQILPQMLCKSFEILAEVERRLGSSFEVLLVADSAFPDCCVDFISAEHRSAALILKIGYTCTTQLQSKPPVVALEFTESSKHAIQLLLPIFREQASCKSYSWKAILTESQGAFDDFVNLCGDESHEILRLSAESIDKCRELPGGLLIVLDANYGRHAALCFMDADICFVESDAAVVLQSRRERAKRWAIISKLAGDDIATGLVVHSSQRIYADLAYIFSKLFKQHGHPTYMLSVGRLSPTKLGNFPDIKAFVIFGCTHIMFRPHSEFLVPLITPFEALCCIGLANFWADPYTFSVDCLTELVQAKSDIVSKCTDVTIHNCEFSLSLLSKRTFQGVPSKVSQDIGTSDVSETNPKPEMYAIHAGLDGTPRSYRTLDI